jgi:hypothetical protein
MNFTRRGCRIAGWCRCLKFVSNGGIW